MRSQVQGLPSVWRVQKAAHLIASPLERALGSGAQVRPTITQGVGGNVLLYRCFP